MCRFHIPYTIDISLIYFYHINILIWKTISIIYYIFEIYYIISCSIFEYFDVFKFHSVLSFVNRCTCWKILLTPVCRYIISELTGSSFHSIYRVKYLYICIRCIVTHTLTLLTRKIYIVDLFYYVYFIPIIRRKATNLFLGGL